jgi:hypothetical protein
MMNTAAAKSEAPTAEVNFNEDQIAGATTSSLHEANAVQKCFCAILQRQGRCSMFATTPGGLYHTGVVSAQNCIGCVGSHKPWR